MLGSRTGRRNIAELLWPDAADPLAAERWALPQVRRALASIATTTTSTSSRLSADRSTNRDPDGPLFPTRSSDLFTEDGFSKLFQRIHRASGLRTFAGHLMQHTWATNFMRVPGASLLELKRQGGWQRWEQVERYSHAVPHHDR